MPVQIDPGSLGSVPVNVGISQRLSNWSARRAQEFSQRQQRKALKEGQQVEIERDPEGRPVKPEEREVGFIGGKTAEQYNIGLRDAYITAIDRDSTENVNRLTQEADGNLSIFDKTVEQFRNTTLANIDPAAQGDIRTSLDSMISRARSKVQGVAIQRDIAAARDERERAAQTYSDEAASLATDGDIEGASEVTIKLRGVLDSMVASGDISKSESDTLFDKQAKRIITSEAKGEVRQLAEQDPSLAFKRIDELKEQRPDMFSPEEWDNSISQMMVGANQVAAINAKAVSDLTIQQKAEISNLEIMARTNTGDPTEVVSRTNELFFEGKITPEKRTSIISSVVNGQQQAKKEALDFASVAERLEGDDSIVVDRKVVDQFYVKKYQPMLEAMASESGQAVEGIKAAFVDRMKYMPSAMKDEVSTMLRSDSIELITQAATFIDRVDEIEGITDQFGKHERALASTTIDLMSNMTPREAVLKARELTDPANQARVEAREKSLKQLTGGKSPDMDYRDEVSGSFESWFSSVDVKEVDHDQLAKEYQDLFEAHYKAGMSLEGAKNKANQLLGRNWGTWGDRVMKHPPDRYYSVGGSADYVQKQLTRFVKENTMGQEFNDVMLVADETTERTAATGSPAYRVILNTDEGLVPLIAGKTGVGHWMPDREKETSRLNEKGRQQFLEKRRRPAGFEALESVRSF